MTKEGEKTPDPAPPKEVIRTPPRIPSLPDRQPGGSVGNEKAANLNAFDFRAAVKNAMVADTGITSPLKPRHDRGVSWDRNVADNEKISPSPPTPGYLQQPEDASGAVSMPTLMARTAARPDALPPRPPPVTRRNISTDSQTSSSYSRRNLNLDSIPDDPYEREAEDVLIEALEERDPMHGRANTGGNILPGVPVDEMKHDFSLETDANENTKGDSGGSPARPTLNRPRLMSRDNQSRASKPSERHLMKPPPSHNRSLTVEEALFGLTAALSAVQHDERKEGLLPAESKHNRMDTANSTDRLAKTAELMFGRRFMRNRSSASNGSEGSPPSSNEASTPGQETPQAPSSTPSTAGGAPVSAKSKWGVVRTSIVVHKKYDIPEGEDDIPEGDELQGVDIDIEAGGDDQDDAEQTDSNHEGKGSNNNGKKKKRNKRITQVLSPFKHLPYADKIKNEWDLFNQFLNPRKASMFTYARYILLYLWIPALGVASLLYHLFENPNTGKGPWDDNSVGFNETVAEEPVEKIEDQASISWWIIFICIREVSIVIMAKCIEAVIVDFLAIQTRAILRTLGPVITLLFVQSKGWPFLLSCWGILNFLLITGDNRFNHHWLFWQDVWGLFNENNPSGDVTNTLWLLRICAVASALGAAVSCKRVFVGVYLGRQTFANYSDKLAIIMHKMLQVSQVAILSQAIEKKYWAEVDQLGDSKYLPQQSTRGFSRDNLLSLIENANDEADEVSMMDMSGKSETADEMGRIIDPDDVDPFTGGLSQAQKARINDLMGRWEEPGRSNSKNVSEA
jgi:hypothetical protein